MKGKGTHTPHGEGRWLAHQTARTCHQWVSIEVSRNPGSVLGCSYPNDLWHWKSSWQVRTLWKWQQSVTAIPDWTHSRVKPDWIWNQIHLIPIFLHKSINSYSHSALGRSQYVSLGQLLERGYLGINLEKKPYSVMNDLFGWLRQLLSLFSFFLSFFVSHSRSHRRLQGQTCACTFHSSHSQAEEGEWQLEHLELRFVRLIHRVSVQSWQMGLPYSQHSPVSSSKVLKGGENRAVHCSSIYSNRNWYIHMQ